MSTRGKSQSQKRDKQDQGEKLQNKGPVSVEEPTKREGLGRKSKHDMAWHTYLFAKLMCSVVLDAKVQGEVFTCSDQINRSLFTAPRPYLILMNSDRLLCDLLAILHIADSVKSNKKDRPKMISCEHPFMQNMLLFFKSFAMNYKLGELIADAERVVKLKYNIQSKRESLEKLLSKDGPYTDPLLYTLPRASRFNKSAKEMEEKIITQLFWYANFFGYEVVTFRDLERLLGVTFTNTPANPECVVLFHPELYWWCKDESTEIDIQKTLGTDQRKIDSVVLAELTDQMENILMPSGEHCRELLELHDIPVFEKDRTPEEDEKMRRLYEDDKTKYRQCLNRKKNDSYQTMSLKTFKNFAGPDIAHDDDRLVDEFATVVKDISDIMLSSTLLRASDCLSLLNIRTVVLKKSAPRAKVDENSFLMQMPILGDQSIITLGIPLSHLSNIVLTDQPELQGITRQPTQADLDSYMLHLETVSQSQNNAERVKIVDLGTVTGLELPEVTECCQNLDFRKFFSIKENPDNYFSLRNAANSWGTDDEIMSLKAIYALEVNSMKDTTLLDPQLPRVHQLDMLIQKWLDDDSSTQWIYPINSEGHWTCLLLRKQTDFEFDATSYRGLFSPSTVYVAAIFDSLGKGIEQFKPIIDNLSTAISRYSAGRVQLIDPTVNQLHYNFADDKLQTDTVNCCYWVIAFCLILLRTKSELSTMKYVLDKLKETNCIGTFRTNFLAWQRDVMLHMLKPPEGKEEEDEVLADGEVDYGPEYDEETQSQAEAFISIEPDTNPEPLLSISPNSSQPMEEEVQHTPVLVHVPIIIAPTQEISTTPLTLTGPSQISSDPNTIYTVSKQKRLLEEDTDGTQESEKKKAKKPPSEESAIDIFRRVYGYDFTFANESQEEVFNPILKIINQATGRSTEESSPDILAAKNLHNFFLQYFPYDIKAMFDHCKDADSAIGDIESKQRELKEKLKKKGQSLKTIENAWQLQLPKDFKTKPVFDEAELNVKTHTVYNQFFQMCVGILKTINAVGDANPPTEDYICSKIRAAHAEIFNTLREQWPTLITHFKKTASTLSADALDAKYKAFDQKCQEYLALYKEAMMKLTLDDD
jgi:hypothetical protein